MKRKITQQNRARITKALSEAPDGHVVSIEEPTQPVKRIWPDLVNQSMEYAWNLRATLAHEYGFDETELAEAVEAKTLMDKRIRENPDAAGWLRLVQILENAEKDEDVFSSAGASDFLDVALKLARITVFRISNGNADGADGITAFRPIGPELAGEQLKDNAGRLKGAQKMKDRKDAHRESLKRHVIEFLRNPATSDWTDPAIARWLMKPERALNVFEGRELSEKAMTGYVREIRGMYKSGNLTS